MNGMARSVAACCALACLAGTTAQAGLTPKPFFYLGGQPVFVLSEETERTATQEAFDQSLNLFHKPAAMSHLYLYSNPTLEEDYYFLLDEVFGLVRAIYLRNGLPEGVYSYVPAGSNVLRRPQSITIGPNGYTSPHRLFILDSGNNRIKRLRVSSGEWPPVDEGFIYSGQGVQPYGPLNDPHDIDYCTLKNDDMVLVADTKNHRVMALRPSGAVLWSVGGPTPGDGSLKFCFPYAVTAVALSSDTDSALIYVADRGNHRVVRLLQYFDEEGQVHIDWQRVFSMRDLPGIKSSVNAISTNWVGSAGLADIEVDPSGRNAGVFVLDSSRGMLLQLDWGLNAVLSTYGSFSDDAATMYDLEISDNNVGVVYSYTKKGGAELFNYTSTVEQLKPTPSEIKTPLEFAVIGMAITGGGALEAWITNAGGATIASITNQPIDVNPGMHYEVWDGTNDLGQFVGTGTYYFKTRLVDAWTSAVDLKSVAVKVTGTPGVRVIAQDAIITHPDWSPDGQRIAFSGGLSGSNYIKVHTIATGQTTTLTSGIGGQRHLYPNYSVDGSKIAWVKELSGANACIQIMDANGSNNISLTCGELTRDMEPVWDPTGRYLSFVDKKIEGNEWLRRYQLNNGMPSGTPEAITFANFISEHAWSPAGDRIAFAGLAPPEFHSKIYANETGTWNFSPITLFDPNFEMYPLSVDWSPGGSELLMILNNYANTFSRVYRMPPVEGEPLPAAGLEGLSEANPGISWSPDGTKFVAPVHGVGQQNLVIFDVERSQEGAFPALCFSTPLPQAAVTGVVSITGTVVDCFGVNGGPNPLSDLASHRVEWSALGPVFDWSTAGVIETCPPNDPGCAITGGVIATWNTGFVRSGNYVLRIVASDGVDSTVVVRPVLVQHDVHTVALDGTKDFTSIQSAVDSGQPGDTVLVYPGTYNTNVVMKDGVSLVSDGSGVTINGQGNDFAIRFQDLSNPVTLKNLEITHASSSTGAGIYVAGASPVIDQCTIRDINGTSAQLGSAVRITQNSSPRFVNCEFRNNSATDGGGVAIWGTLSYAPTATFVRCNFLNNSGRSGKGGGVWLQYATTLDASKQQPSFSGCVFDGNSAADGSAVWIENCYRPTFESCLFVDNTATATSFSATLSSGTGPGQSGALISQCTLANNTVAVQGAVVGLTGLSIAGKTVVLENSIVAFNANAVGTRSSFESRYDVTQTDFFSNASGDTYWLASGGNFNEDPAFCDATGDDYHLQAFSPATRGPGYVTERIGALDVGCAPGAAVTASADVANFPAKPWIIVACPKGDYRTLNLTVALNGPITRNIGASELTLDAVDCVDAVGVFDNDGTIEAFSGAAAPNYQASFVHGYWGGHGSNEVDVLLNGYALDQQAEFEIRSPDTDGNGVVGLSDFAALGAHYTSPPKPYGVAVDYSPPEGIIDLADAAVFGAHYNHQAPVGHVQINSDVPTSDAGITLHFVEEFPSANTHRLYVDVSVEQFADVTISAFSLRAGSERLALLEWQPSNSPIGQLIFTPVVRDEVPELFFGVFVSDAFTSDGALLGRMVFDVVGSEPFQISEDNFVLSVGDVMLGDPESGSIVVEMEGVLRRTLDPAMSLIYHDDLEQNFPNPFNPTTTIAFSIKDARNVNLTIYDVAGRRVRELVNERRERGAYKVVWDGRNDAGQGVASGVYFYKLVAGSFTDTKKMTLLK